MFQELFLNLSNNLNNSSVVIIWLFQIIFCYLSILLSLKFFGKTGIYVYVAIAIILANIQVLKVVDSRPGEIMFGLNLIVNRGKTIFLCDTSVIEYPDAKQLAEMAKSAARVVRLFGFDPKIAFLSHSTFGEPATDRTKRLSDAVEILKKDNVDFKFDGEMQPDVALEEVYKELYPFSEIVGSSNVLIMPSQHSAAISYKMIKSMSRAKVIGPLLVGLGQPIEIAPLRSSTSDIINLASIAAYSADVIQYKKN